MTVSFCNMAFRRRKDVQTTLGKVHLDSITHQYLSLKISREICGQFALSVTRIEIEHGQFWRQLTPISFIESNLGFLWHIIIVTNFHEPWLPTPNFDASGGGAWRLLAGGSRNGAMEVFRFWKNHMQEFVTQNTC